MDSPLTDCDYIRYFLITAVVIGGLVKFGFIVPTMISHTPDYVVVIVVACVALLLGLFLAHRYYYGAWRDESDRVHIALFLPLAFVFHCIPCIIIFLFYYIMNFAIYNEYMEAKESNWKDPKRYGEMWYCFGVFVISNILSLIGFRKDSLILACCLKNSSEYISDQIYQKTIGPGGFGGNASGGGMKTKTKLPTTVKSLGTDDGSEFGKGGMGEKALGTPKTGNEFGPDAPFKKSIPTYQPNMFGITAGAPPPPAGETRLKISIRTPSEQKAARKAGGTEDDGPTYCTRYVSVYYFYFLILIYLYYT